MGKKQPHSHNNNANPGNFIAGTRLLALFLNLMNILTFPILEEVRRHNSNIYKGLYVLT